MCNHHRDGENSMRNYRTLSLELTAGQVGQGRSLQGRGRGQGV